MNTRRGANVASIAAFILLASLAFPHAARAATTVQLNDPFTDALQLWSAVATSIDTAAHQLAAALGQQQPLTSSSPEKPHAPRSLTPASLAAAAASINVSAADTSAAAKSATPTSHNATLSPFVKSAASN
jgi:hypothetical protein